MDRCIDESKSLIRIYETYILSEIELRFSNVCISRILFLSEQRIANWKEGLDSRMNRRQGGKKGNARLFVPRRAPRSPVIDRAKDVRFDFESTTTHCV